MQESNSLLVVSMCPFGLSLLLEASDSYVVVASNQGIWSFSLDCVLIRTPNDGWNFQPQNPILLDMKEEIIAITSGRFYLSTALHLTTLTLILLWTCRAESSVFSSDCFHPGKTFTGSFTDVPELHRLLRFFQDPLLIEGDHPRLKEWMLWLQMRQPPVLLPRFHSSPCSHCPRKRDGQTRREVGRAAAKAPAVEKNSVSLRSIQNCRGIYWLLFYLSAQLQVTILPSDWPEPLFLQSWKCPPNPFFVPGLYAWKELNKLHLDWSKWSISLIVLSLGGAGMTVLRKQSRAGN